MNKRKYRVFSPWKNKGLKRWSPQEEIAEEYNWQETRVRAFIAHLRAKNRIVQEIGPSKFIFEGTEADRYVLEMAGFTCYFEDNFFCSNLSLGI